MFLLEAFFFSFLFFFLLGSCGCWWDSLEVVGLRSLVFLLAGTWGAFISQVLLKVPGHVAICLSLALSQQGYSLQNLQEDLGLQSARTEVCIM